MNKIVIFPCHNFSVQSLDNLSKLLLLPLLNYIMAFKLLPLRNTGYDIIAALLELIFIL